jgi:putative ABC transport system permease protein
MIARIRSLLRGIRRGEQLHDDMDAEFAHHIELRAADLVRAGMTPADAARHARLEFGSAESYKDAGREARGLRRFDGMRLSLLDFKLGARMLVKYPGLTLVGGIAIAFAIGIGAGAFEFITQVLHAKLPIPPGQEVVGLRLWHPSHPNAQWLTLHDLERWRSEMKTVQHVSGWAKSERNFTTGREPGAPLMVVDATPSMFRVTRTPPLMGRVLQDSDTLPAAPDVAVIGYDVWQSRLGGAPDIIGREVRIGVVPTTIVGVMPQGYTFPFSEGVWRPLRLKDPGLGRQGSPAISRIVGVLAPGRTKSEATRELTAVVQSEPRQNADKRPYRGDVAPYTRVAMGFSNFEMAAVWSSNLFLIVLLVLICGNVALLMFARAASRQVEIAVRNALGASRRRIVMQLFAEALVLCVVAATVGLVVVNGALGWGETVLVGQLGTLPMWMHTSLSPLTIVYSFILAVIAAVVTGVFPALKITAGGLESRLRASSAGAGGARFGGVWTAVIVTQVAITVLLPVITFGLRRDFVRLRDLPAGFAAERILAAELGLDRAPESGLVTEAQKDSADQAHVARLAQHYRTLEQKLLAEPGVTGVTYADKMPLAYHPHRLIELDDGPAAPINPEWPEGYRVSDANVDPRFFDVIGVPILSGRNLTTTDADTSQRNVLVNESFVRRVMGGANPVGRRLRYVYFEGQSKNDPYRKPGPWFHVVGVVRDIGVWGDEYDPKVARIYNPVMPHHLVPLKIAVQVSGNAENIAPRLRELAADVEPSLRVHEAGSLREYVKQEADFNLFWFKMTSAITLVAVGLALAGIYAVLAFTVAKRTREIGVRVALGASRIRVILAIFRRPMIQIGLGLLTGAILTAGLMGGASGGRLIVQGMVAALGSAAGIALACILACVVPTRRALRVQPTEALRAES